METIVERVLSEAMEQLRAAGKVPQDLRLPIVIERPKREEFGDFGCALPLALAKATRRNPMECGKELMAAIQAPDGLFEAVTFAPPGYLNFKVATAAWFDRMKDVTTLPAVGAGEKVLLEFVSANPTGPLHVGHGRGAVLGDAIARVMRATGYAVQTEYYVNDVGNQMAMMGLSLHCRGREALGLSDGSDFPENGYKGQYVRDVAAEFVATAEGKAACEQPYEDIGARDDNPCTHFAEQRLLVVIQDTLKAGGIHFDRWFTERTLHQNGALAATVQRLLDQGHAYRDEAGATLFRMEGKADEDDRVMVRASGVPTYFAADIAYHDDKARRGFTRLINIWGADHHGYIPRMKASLEALGHDPACLQVLLVQMVTLTRGGVAVPMGKRSGEFVTLQEVLEEVGQDAVRFLFLLRKADSQMEFDLDLAKSQSMENPVYYVQYGHARVASILRKAAAQGIAVPGWEAGMGAVLTLPEEAALVKDLARFAAVVASAARRCEPHHIAFYLMDLVKGFHAYYTRNAHTEKVISADPVKTAARLFLVARVQSVLAEGLALLGVSAPEEMRLTADDEPASEPD
jgi:arginyl-tRNA synthetase